MSQTVGLQNLLGRLLVIGASMERARKDLIMLVSAPVLRVSFIG